MEDKPRKKMGRPSKYDGGYEASFPELGFRLALLGADDKEIADVFGIDVSTLNDWKLAHPDFADSLKNGKCEADAHVADSLYRTALGYERDEEEIKVIAGDVVRVPVKRYYPPVPSSIIFWLKNRQRAKWRDKVETGITDKDGNDVPLDPVEAARRIAFVLAQGVSAQDDVPTPEARH